MALSNMHILRIDEEETSRRKDGAPRFCFRCRKKQAFDRVVYSPVEDRENPSYYGPRVAIECTACGKEDADCFPGRQREWEDL